MKSEGTTSAERINQYIDIEQSQREFMDSIDDPYGEHDKGMEMLAGVILTLMLTAIVACIFLIYKVSTWS